MAKRSTNCSATSPQLRVLTGRLRSTPALRGFTTTALWRFTTWADTRRQSPGFDQAIALNPGHARAFNHRGNALFELRRISAALASYAAAIALDADYAEAYNNQGSAQLELEQYSAALDQLSTAR